MKRYSIHYSIAQNDEHIAETVISGLSAGSVTLTYHYPASWRTTDLKAVAGHGGALQLVSPDALGVEIPTAVSALFLVETDRAIHVFDQANTFPFPVTSYMQAPQPFVLDDRDAAMAFSTIQGNHATVAVSLQVAQNLFLVSQTVSLGADLTAIQDQIFAIATSAEVTFPRQLPTSTNTPVPLPTEPPRRCPYKANFAIQRLRVIHAEEAGTGRDFGAPGDQSTLIVELGPVVGVDTVNAGTRGEFQFRWSANLFSGESRENVGTYTRDVCEGNFGVVMYMYEDDSTPFAQVLPTTNW